MITPQTILQHEIIGLKATITDCTDRSLIGRYGEIIDETRQTVTLLSGDRSWIIPKQIATFHMSLPNRNVIEVQGRALLGRPEDRTKTRVGRHL